ASNTQVNSRSSYTSSFTPVGSMRCPKHPKQNRTINSDLHLLCSIVGPHRKNIKVRLYAHHVIKHDVPVFALIDKQLDNVTCRSVSDQVLIDRIVMNGNRRL